MLTKCPCREANLKPHDFRDPGEHFYAKCLKSDSGHVMWLNRNITKTKTDPRTLAKSLVRSSSNGDVNLFMETIG